MWEAFRRFSALEGSARSLFLRAVFILPAISITLRWRGFRVTQDMLRQSERGKPSKQIDRYSTDELNRTALVTRMVRAAARYGIGHTSCLEESLALWWLLAREGVPSEIRIGIRKNDGKFEAHAWVEQGGVALNEPEERHKHYATFDTAFPSAPPESP